MRDYRRAAKTARDTRQQRRGVEGFRQTLIEEFERMGTQEMNGNTAARIVREHLRFVPIVNRAVTN